MSFGQNPGTINWKTLSEAVRNKECVLVLGPNIATVEIDGAQVPLNQLLSDFISKKLLLLNPSVQLLSTTNLAYAAKEFEDNVFHLAKFNKEKAREMLGEVLKEFYNKYSFSDFPVYQKLARLPFYFVVNTNSDNFLMAAYDEENKFGTTCEYYHFLDPTHNNRVNIREEEISPEMPLVYNLFGNVDNPESMVLTDSDQLRFLDAILQLEHTASIPKSIAIQFTSSEARSFNKSFIFLGFDFNQWHLRLLMHIISRYQRQKATYALQNPRNLGELTAFFYERNFDMQFVDIPPLDFANAFEAALSQEVANNESTPKLKVFVMFDSADTSKKERLDAQLSPLRRGELIQSWDEHQIRAGEERAAEIDRNLSEADIILLLVTPNFFASDEIYENQLKKALKRHDEKQAVVIPVLMANCLWESSVLKSLATILPRNRKPLGGQENLDVELAGVVEQIEKICQKIFLRKSKPLVAPQ